MAQRPAFGALKKAKPAPETPPAPAPEAAPVATAPARIQTSIRLEPSMWAALNSLATRKTLETGQRVTMHDLLIEGGRHVLAIHGIKMS